MKRDKRGRTDKVFVDYNDYRDRPFGLKWGTAFAMDELKNAIKSGEDEFIDRNEVLERMSREEIDKVLQISVLKSKRISIQLNVYNEYEHIEDRIEGLFQGYADSENMYINDEAISWDLIRNVKLI